MSDLSTAGAERVAQRRLQSLADGLGRLDVTEEIALAARLLRAELPRLPAYGALDEDHQAYYDLATGLRAVMSLLAPALLRANRGLAKLKEGDQEQTFSVPDLAERERWAGEVAAAVAHLSKLGQAARRPSGFAMFGAAGVARARQRAWFDAAAALGRYLPPAWCELAGGGEVYDLRLGPLRPQ